LTKIHVVNKGRSVSRKECVNLCYWASLCIQAHSFNVTLEDQLTIHVLELIKTTFKF